MFYKCASTKAVRIEACWYNVRRFLKRKGEITVVVHFMNPPLSWLTRALYEPAHAWSPEESPGPGCRRAEPSLRPEHCARRRLTSRSCHLGRLEEEVDHVLLATVFSQDLLELFAGRARTAGI